LACRRQDLGNTIARRRQPSRIPRDSKLARFSYAFGMIEHCRALRTNGAEPGPQEIFQPYAAILDPIGHVTLDTRDIELEQPIDEPVGITNDDAAQADRGEREITDVAQRRRGECHRGLLVENETAVIVRHRLDDVALGQFRKSGDDSL
jgi:hypothetical protein